MTEMATKWLMGGRQIQCGKAEQRDELHLGKTEQVLAGFYHAAPNSAWFKIYELFISALFHIIFLNCSWLWVTETLDMKTVNKRDCWTHISGSPACMGNIHANTSLVLFFSLVNLSFVSLILQPPPLAGKKGGRKEGKKGEKEGRKKGRTEGEKKEGLVLGTFFNSTFSSCSTSVWNWRVSNDTRIPLQVEWEVRSWMLNWEDSFMCLEPKLTAWIRSPTVPLTSCVIWGKPFHFFRPQFTH